MADGTVVVTTPTEHAELRTVKMPLRTRTRSQSRADRIKAERAINDAERNRPPPF